MDEVGRSGSGHVSSFIYVDDAIWVDNASGSMLTGSVGSWEWARKPPLDEGARNDRKAVLEGGRRAKAKVLGFAIDTEANWISVPGPKITASQIIIPAGSHSGRESPTRNSTKAKMRIGNTGRTPRRCGRLPAIPSISYSGSPMTGKNRVDAGIKRSGGVSPRWGTYYDVWLGAAISPRNLSAATWGNYFRPLRGLRDTNNGGRPPGNPATPLH